MKKPAGTHAAGCDGYSADFSGTDYHGGSLMTLTRGGIRARPRATLALTAAATGLLLCAGIAAEPVIAATIHRWREIYPVVRPCRKDHHRVSVHFRPTRVPQAWHDSPRRVRSPQPRDGQDLKRWAPPQGQRKPRKGSQVSVHRLWPRADQRPGQALARPSPQPLLVRCRRLR